MTAGGDGPVSTYMDLREDSSLQVGTWSVDDLIKHHQSLTTIGVGGTTKPSQHKDTDISGVRTPVVRATPCYSLLIEHSPDLAISDSGTFVGKTDSAVPHLREDLEKMARRRFQNPKPFKEGAFWWLLCWQDEFVNGKRIRKRKRVKLAPATMAAREARKVATEYISPLNQGLVSLGSATNFTEYVNNTYKVNNLPLMAASTCERYSGVIKNYLIPAFGSQCLRDLTPMTVQGYFSGMAGSNLSHESLDKIKDVLSSILGSAKKYGLLVTNPVEGVGLPPSKRGSHIKPYVNPTQFLTLMEIIPEPYASMVFVAIYTGLRVSEVIGLKWRNVHADSITVDERYCRGDWGCPKSEASNATIAVNQAVIERLERLKMLTVEVRAGRAVRKIKVVRSAAPEDLVFQSLIKAHQCGTTTSLRGS